MASKRKLEARAKRVARKNAQTKPGGASRYATKHRRMIAGWVNSRSPFRVSESSVEISTVDARAATAGLPDVDLADYAREIAEAPL